MATTDAISAVCKAIVHILTTSMAEQAADLNWTDISPSFEVYTSQDFTQGDITAGASLFLYRVLPNLSHRTPAGRLRPDGRREFNKLPLDLHLIITIWGGTADTQNRLVGWVMRTLEDYPIIPASILNIGSDDPIFNPDEDVELILSEIDSDELLQLWDMLRNGEGFYQLSIPYLVRNVTIDSRRVVEPGAPVQIRTLDMQRFNGADE